VKASCPELASSPPLRAAALLLSLAASACDLQFEPGSTVSNVRILGVQGAPTYAAPGETVSLEALAVDPLGRKLSIAWATCVNPAASTVGGCFLKIADDAAAGRPPAITMGDELTKYTFTVPGDAIASLPQVAARYASVGVVTVVCPGTISFDTATQSPGALPVRCLDGGGAPLPPEGYVISVKRIAVRARDRNANPEIASITWNGAPWPEDELREVSACRNDPTQFLDCEGGEEPTVGVLAAPGASEKGIDEFGTPFTEQVVAQYYATQGAFEYEVTAGDSAGTRWVARHGASGTDQSMWFVLRDDRGGVSWTSRRVRVR
jgi:hypothetical protein